MLREGQEQSYQPPIPDRAFIVLRQSEPRYTDEARKKRISGSVALVVEFLPDSSVGEVEIAKGLEASLDQAAAEAARRAVFLPAVKDRKFVPVRMPMVMTFHLY